MVSGDCYHRGVGGWRLGLCKRRKSHHRDSCVNRSTLCLACCDILVLNKATLLFIHRTLHKCDAPAQQPVQAPDGKLASSEAKIPLPKQKRSGTLRTRSEEHTSELQS